MFKVGDKIVYPLHGAGVIDAIEKMTFMGEEKEYFILKMPIGDMDLSLIHISEPTRPCGTSRMPSSA